MDLSQLASLKQQLVHSNKYIEVLDFFLTNFGEKKEFIALGERYEDEFLENVLLQVGAQIFTTPAVVAELLMTRLAEHHFIHGGGMLNGYPINVLYFDDIHVGLISVAMPIAEGGTRLARFSGRKVPRGGRPSPN
jgi:hypothetical protein